MQDTYDSMRRLILRLAAIHLALFLARAAQASQSGARHSKRDHDYLLQSAHGAERKKDAFLVAIYTSAGDAGPSACAERRSWVREQWAKNVRALHGHHEEGGRHAMPRVYMLFAIGAEDITDEDLQTLQREEEDFGDILLLHGINEVDEGQPDADRQWEETSVTTQKVLHGIHWAVEHYKFQYLARIADEVYFRPDEFYKQATAGDFPTSMAAISYYIGPLQYPVAGKHTSIVFPFGGGYIITSDVAAFIASSAGILSVGFHGNAHFGAWMAGTRLQYVHAADRVHDLNSDSPAHMPCSARDILVNHMQTESDWHRIDDLGRIDC